jgi:hypothetical protein
MAAGCMSACGPLHPNVSMSFHYPAGMSSPYIVVFAGRLHISSCMCPMIPMSQCSRASMVACCMRVYPCTRQHVSMSVHCPAGMSSPCIVVFAGRLHMTDHMRSMIPMNRYNREDRIVCCMSACPCTRQHVSMSFHCPAGMLSPCTFVFGAHLHMTDHMRSMIPTSQCSRASRIVCCMSACPCTRQHVSMSFHCPAGMLSPCTFVFGAHLHMTGHMRSMIPTSQCSRASRIVCCIA